MADKDVLALIRKREADRGRGMLDAYGSIMAVQENYSEQAERDATIAALAWLVKDLQECAELYLRAQMRGGKGNADDLRTAAGVLAPIVNQLRKLGDDSPPDWSKLPAEWCGEQHDHGPHDWRAHVGTVGEVHRWCTGHHSRDTTGLDALIAERSGTAADGTVPSPVGAYLRGAANDIPGSPPLRPGSVPPAPPDEIERALQPSGIALAVLERTADPFDDPYPVTDTALGMGQQGCSGLPVMPADWSGPSTNAEGFRVPGAAPPAVDLFDDPAPRRGTVGRKISWADLREIIGTDRRGAGLPLHLSHSQMDTLGECGFKYLAQRDEELGVVEIPQWSLIGGNAFHTAVEWFERVAAEVRQPQYVRDRLTVFRDEHGGRGQTPAEALWAWAFGQEITEVALSSGVPQDDWRAANKGLENYTWWLINGGDMVQRYLEARLTELGGAGWRSIRQHPNAAGFDGPDGSYSPMIEHELHMVVEGVPFTGFIDQVWTITEQHGRMMPGDLLVDDCKSGARVGAGGDTRQLGEYALWLLQHEQSTASPLALSLTTGRVRIWGRYYDARKGTWTEPVDLLARHPVDELAVRVTVADAKKAGGMFVPQRSNFCGGCSVKHACPEFAATAS
jgi:hypothetical protein